MTTTQRQRPSRPAPHAPDPARRGLILVAVAVAVGIILLVKGGGGGFDRDDTELEIGAGTEGAEEQVEASTTTAPPPETSVPPAELQIVALNAAGIDGYAGQSQQFLSVAGYTAVTPITAAAPAQETVVHFAEGYEVDAAMIVQRLELELGALQPMPEDPSSLARDPSEFPAEANVAVVLGPDVAPIVQGAAAQAAVGGGDEADATADAGADAGT